MVLGKVDGWRQGLGEKMIEQGRDSALEIAYSLESARLAWEQNTPDNAVQRSGSPALPGIYGSLDSVDFTRQAVVVFSYGASETCPGWLADLQVDGATVAVTTASATGGLAACTADFKAYRLVLALDRHRLPQAGLLTQGTVLIDGRVARGGTLIQAYPQA